ncbi:MAG: 4-oxalocrotonate tautomerase [Clostridia bacterium]
MANLKSLCAKIDIDLHNKISKEKEQSGHTLNEYIEELLIEYYEMKERGEMEKTRTLAVQIPEDLFLKLKEYLKANNLKQKDFLLNLIEEVISEKAPSDHFLSEE